MVAGTPACSLSSIAVMPVSFSSFSTSSAAAASCAHSYASAPLTMLQIARRGCLCKSLKHVMSTTTHQSPLLTPNSIFRRP